MGKVMQCVLCISLLSLTACSDKLLFSSMNPDAQGVVDIPTPPPIIPDPVTPTPEPPVVPPPAPAPVSKLSDGACAGDSSTNVLSCLKCNVPLNPPAPPQLSQKGSALLEGMAMSCGVLNSSDPAGYVPPTRAQLLERMNRLSPTMYPDTAMTSQQASVIAGLINPNDASMRNRLFSGLWYQPPYSDAFETYFGIRSIEARYFLCYGSSATFGLNTNTYMHSKSYLDCTYNGNGCTESSSYVTANGYRGQLQNALRESISNPYVAPPPTPSKVCTWKKYEGNDPVVARAKINEWTAAGYKVGLSIIEGSGAGYCGVSLPDSLVEKTVHVGAYICQ